MERGLSFLVGLAALVGIVAGGIYISKHVDIGCVDLYFYKTCGVAIKQL